MIKLYSPSRTQFLFAALTLLFTRATAQQVAPVYPPQGGFHIDGNLRANTFIANKGDWLTGPGGTGGYVMTDTGVPLDTTTTFHFVDLWNSSNDDQIIGQANQNPNTDWSWVLAATPAKADLNNVLIYFTRDSIGCHKWMMFAADRMSSNGTSYVDFELLQNTLIRNGNGTFTSVSLAGGRTVNDLLFTVEYTNGGSQANIDCYKWDTVSLSPLTFDYVSFFPPNGSRYGFTSSGGEPVPYMAFGMTTYLSNQFVEGMLDLDAIVQAYITSIDSVVFKTLTVKTKVSPSLSATCADMLAPIQLNNLSIDCITGIEENPWQSGISISPNPAHGSFKISFDEWNAKAAELSIYDVCGRLIYVQEIRSQMSTIACPLTKGLYFVTIAEGPKQFTQKLVID